MRLFSTVTAAALIFSTVLPQIVSAATAPPLGTVVSFAVLGGSTVTNTGPTNIVGNLGVSPGSAITGFPPGVVVPPGTIHAGDATAATAQSDNTTAYNTLAGEGCNFDLTGQDLGGLTLVPGVYCFSSSAQLTGTLTLNFQGNPSSVFVFQIGTTLTTASNSSVVIINGPVNDACNVFWQVGSSATLGTTTSFLGNIFALTSITLNTGATIVGRALAQNGAVTMDTNTVTISACSASFVAPPILAQSFSPTAINLGGTATLSFQITNPDLSAIDVSFTDLLPAGLVVAGTPGISSTCGGTLTAAAGSGSVSFSNSTFAAAAQCAISLTVQGISLGLENNTVTIMSAAAGTGLTSTASLAVSNFVSFGPVGGPSGMQPVTIDYPYEIAYFSNLTTGDSYINITNTGARGSVGLGAAANAGTVNTGTICANVYTFGADEEFMSCCSCPVTPDGLVSLSVQNDLVANTAQNINLLGGTSAIVVKLLATVPTGISAGSAGTCTGSAFLQGTPTLANGLVAFGTHLHANTSMGVSPAPFRLTEDPFQAASLDTSFAAGTELTRLAGLCSVYTAFGLQGVGQGSGTGVCNSCRLGGLEAASSTKARKGGK